MWRISFSSRPIWMTLGKQPVPGQRERGRQTRTLSLPGLEVLEDRLAPATFKVASSSELLAAISAASSNTDSSNTIRLQPGTYAVANQMIQAAPSKMLTIVGGGAVLTANQQGRVFEINANVQFVNLTLTGGLVQGTLGGAVPQGGGLLIDGGTVTLTNAVVQGNTVMGADVKAAANPGDTGQVGQSACGGGICLAAGSLTIMGTTLRGNVVKGGKGGDGGAAGQQNAGDRGPTGGPGGEANGGAVYVSAGTLVVQGGSIKDNQVLGGPGGAGGLGAGIEDSNGDLAFNAGGTGGAGGAARGGGFSVVGGTATLFSVTIEGNRAQGGKGGSASGDAGDGGAGGPAMGGGGYVTVDTTLVVSTFTNDSALGDRGGDGQAALTSLIYSSRGGEGGAGGSASGGGLFQEAGNLLFYSGAISGCTATGGPGGLGAYYFAGAGGGGGYGGAAGGGAIDSAHGSTAVYNAVLAHDQVIGGDGGTGTQAGSAAFVDYGVDGHEGGPGGPGGDATGGGIVGGDRLTLVGATLASDSVQGGNGGAGGVGSDGAVGAEPIEGVSGVGRGGNGGNGGKGGGGGDGLGGGLYTTELAFTTLYSYAGSIAGIASGGRGNMGGNGGNGGNGGISSDEGISSGPGGNGGDLNEGPGGDGMGGGVYLGFDTIPTIDGTSLSGSVQAGPAGQGGTPGQAGAGGMGDLPGENGQPGGIYAAPGVADGGPILNLAFFPLLKKQPGPPTQLVISPMPSSVAAGSKFANPVYVVAEDASGNVSGDYNGKVTIQLAAGPKGSTLGGKLTVKASNGVAVFSDLSLAQLGMGYALQAIGKGGVQVAPAISSPRTNLFNVVNVQVLKFKQQPTGAFLGKPIQPAIQVEVDDSTGKRLTSYQDTVTIGLGVNPGSGTLAGKGNVPVVNGVATFSDLSIDKLGRGYTLVASLDDGTQASSAPFNVGPGFVVTRQPPNQVKVGQPFDITVAAVDANGKPNTKFTGAVTLALASTPGNAQLDGSQPVTAVGGVAHFTGLALDKVGDGYTLQASAAGTNPVTTGPVNVVDEITSHTWSGLGKTNNWSDPDNWLEDTKPESGQRLIFPADADSFTTLDDLPNLRIAGLEIDAGYNFDDFNNDVLDLAGDVLVTAGNSEFDIDTDLEEDSAGPTLASPAVRVLGPLASPTATNDLQILLKNPNSHLVWRHFIEGPDGLVKDGPGELLLLTANTYTGETVLKNGTLTLGDKAALGTGTLVVDAAGNTATLNAVQPVELSNPLTVKAGTLNVQGQVTFARAIMSTLVGEIDPAKKAIVTLKGGLSGTLTLGGEGVIQFDQAFSGNGALVVNGCTLSSSVANQYQGDITLQAGTILASKTNNVLGSGKVMVNPTADPVNLDFQNAEIDLDNDITLGGGTINLNAKTVKFKGTITVTQDTTIKSVNNSFLYLRGTASGSGNLVFGGEGTLKLASSLNVGVTGTDQATLAFTQFLNGSGSVTLNGGTLNGEFGGTSNSHTLYSGTITLNAGKVEVDETPNGLGTGPLVVIGAVTLNASGSQHSSDTLGNELDLNGGTLSVTAQ